MKAFSNRSASEGQGVEFVCRRRGFVFNEIEPPVLDHVHGLDACNDGASTLKRLGFQPRSHEAFDGAIMLLDQIVEVVRLPQLDVRAAVGAHDDDGRCDDFTLVDRDLLGHALQVDGAFDKTPRCGKTQCARIKKSMVWPARSNIRHRCFHSPLTWMEVSSIRQFVPIGGLRRQTTPASASIILIDPR